MRCVFGYNLDRTDADKICNLGGVQVGGVARHKIPADTDAHAAARADLHYAAASVVDTTNADG